MTTLTCGTCGAALGESALFCGECGARVGSGGATATQPTVPISALIAPPPGVVEKPATASVVPRSEITAPPPARPIARPPVATPAPAPIEEDFDATVLSPRRRIAWSIVTPDGSWVPIRQATVIGRSPVIPADRADVAIMPLTDDSKSLSKTHAILVPDGDSFTIEDLGSTNGVIVTTRDGAVTDAAAGVPVELTVGCVVELGDYLLVVERS